VPTPDFILQLRTKVGHDLLWLGGVSAVVFDDEGRVLLVRRTDNGRWALVGGILEPGEQPAQAVVREVFEETGVVVEVERMSSCWAGEAFVIEGNGDQVQFLDHSFRCRYVSGVARVSDDESIDVGWFALEDLPAGMKPDHLRRLEHALAADGPPFFYR
jgi:8-oxo-dGTP pyrophosphatase MutT (NUDIX family)